VGQAQKSGRVKPVNRIPTVPLLIIGSPIQIKTNYKKPCTDSHPLKKTTYYLKKTTYYLKKTTYYLKKTTYYLKKTTST
jgi:hypothetical protein